jgi:hypothetical protein
VGDIHYETETGDYQSTIDVGISCEFDAHEGSAGDLHSTETHNAQYYQPSAETGFQGQQSGER